MRKVQGPTKGRRQAGRLLATKAGAGALRQAVRRCVLKGVSATTLGVSWVGDRRSGKYGRSVFGAPQRFPAFAG